MGTLKLKGVMRKWLVCTGIQDTKNAGKIRFSYIMMTIGSGYIRKFLNYCVSYVKNRHFNLVCWEVEVILVRK